MNARALLKGLLVVAVLLGVVWLWWQSTTPDLPVGPTASASLRAKPAIAYVFAPKPLPEQVVVAAPATNVNDSAPPKDAAFDTHTLAQQDPSLPDSAYLTVPLDQAEHHMFKEGPITKEASIAGYYHDDTGREWVELYIWQVTLPSGDTRPGGTGTERVPIAYYPDEQDYIHSWAKQQAAAKTPPAPQSSSDAEPPAPYVPPAPSGPVVITN